MLPRRRSGAIAAGGVMLGIAALMAGCAGLGEPKRAAESSAQEAERPPSEAVLFAGCIETLDRLAHGTPTQQAEILAQSKTAAERGPQRAYDQLRYALVLAQPGHPGNDPAEARVRLRQLILGTMADKGLAHAMALLELQRLDREFALVDETRRLTNEAERTERERIAPLNRRLQSELEENARLRHSLDEARAKLDAIMNIERSITERKPAGEVKKP